jgi:NADH dehydrogenase FAD-containing subunit
MLCTLIGNATIELGLEAGMSEEEKSRLLQCYVVVGGGPTGVEFSGELMLRLFRRKMVSVIK